MKREITTLILTSIQLLEPIQRQAKKFYMLIGHIQNKLLVWIKIESDQILKEIFEHQARLDLTCRFNWTENTVAIWDNRSVIHYAIADFFPGRGLGHERIMDRIAIEGDQPQ